MRKLKEKVRTSGSVGGGIGRPLTSHGIQNDSNYIMTETKRQKKAKLVHERS